MGRQTSLNIGDRFGELTVIDITSGSGAGIHTRAKVICSCGIEKTVASHSLRQGKTKSCGCKRYDPTYIKQRDPNTYKRLPNGESAFNALYNNYQLTAKRRGYDFSLDKEEFRGLTQNICYYCGIAPHRVAKNGKSEYTYNGIDRIDNDIGYIHGNVRTACYTCNQAKHGMSETDFMAWIKRLIDKWK